MNRRNLIIAVLFIIMIVVGTVGAKMVWSICDTAASPGCADYAESQGYWNFQYDDAAPYTTAGLYCCWWERWYKWQKFSDWKGEQNTLNLGSSDDALSVETKSWNPTDNTITTTSKKTESYCPSCCATCDDEDPSALQARSDAMMAKKPWLTEGKNTQHPTTTPTASVTATPTVAQMTFSDAK